MKEGSFEKASTVPLKLKSINSNHGQSHSHSLWETLNKKYLKLTRLRDFLDLKKFDSPLDY